MWPTHCVQNTYGAQFHEDLEIDEKDIIIDKGLLERTDSYSGFGSPPEKTGLADRLREKLVTHITCVGLAYDYSVGSTARDGSIEGFTTYLVSDATKSVSSDNAEIMSKSLQEHNVIEIQSSTLLAGQPQF